MPGIESIESIENFTQALDYRVSFIDRVVLLAWFSSPTLAGVNALREALQACRERHPGQTLGFFTMITRPATKGELSARARDALIETLKNYSPVLSAATITYEDEGFRATIVRSVITSIQLIVRAKFMTGVYKSREVAVRDLLAQLVPHTISEGAMLSAIDQLLEGQPAVARSIRASRRPR